MRQDLLDKRLAIIGCGNLAETIVKGLLERGKPPISLMATARRKERLEYLHTQYQIHAEANNQRAVAAAEILIFAAKPQQMADICRDLAAIDCSSKLIISVAAGLPTERFEQWLGQPLRIVRSMPNTPAAVQQAATGLFANVRVSIEDKRLTEEIFSAIGRYVWLNDEALMDVVTAIAGSGPAYFFQIMESMICAAEAQGMPRETATLLVTQTCLGAGSLATAIGAESVSVLREKVTSKGGTTDAALKSLTQDGIDGMFSRAIQAAVTRGKELANS